jgi:hypothetical protein
MLKAKAKGRISMTKALFLIVSLVLLPAAHATSVRISPEDSLKLVESLLLAGVQADTTRPVYSVDVQQVECKARFVSHAGSPDDVLWGMTEYTCSAPNLSGASARMMYETLDTIQSAYTALVITDCAMGKCYTTLKQVACTIDSNEVETSKRFSCLLTDEQ